MRLLTLLFLPLLALADEVEKNVSALRNISTKITTLNNTLNSYNPSNPLTGLPNLFQIQSQSNVLASSIHKAYAIANSSQPFNDSGAQYVAVITFELQAPFVSLLSNFIRRKPDFDRAIAGVGSVSPQIERDLVLQRNETRSLGGVLVPKMTLTFYYYVDYFFRQILGKYDEAVGNYSRAGGVVAVPPIAI